MNQLSPGYQPGAFPCYATRLWRSHGESNSDLLIDNQPSLPLNDESVVDREGFEPSANRLRADYSGQAELPIHISKNWRSEPDSNRRYSGCSRAPWASWPSDLAHRQGVEPRTPSFGDSDGRRSTVLGGDGGIRTLNSQGLSLKPLPLGYVPIWLAWSGLNRLSLAYKTMAYTCYASRRW